MVARFWSNVGHAASSSLLTNDMGQVPSKPVRTATSQVISDEPGAAKEKAAGHYSVRLSNATAGFPVPPLNKQLTSWQKVPSSGSVDRT